MARQWTTRHARVDEVRNMLRKYDLNDVLLVNDSLWIMMHLNIGLGFIYSDSEARRCNDYVNGTSDTPWK